MPLLFCDESTPDELSATTTARHMIPVGPGPSPAPRFEADPMAWFAWADRVMTDAPATLTEATRPALWVDGRGHGWRVVVTTEGPELRPNLENPFLQLSDLPLITAILVTRSALRVELTTRDARRVATVPVGLVSVADIGCAMLTAMELPHDGIDRFDAREWKRARDRWAGTPRARPRSRRAGSARRTRPTAIKSQVEAR